MRLPALVMAVLRTNGCRSPLICSSGKPLLLMCIAHTYNEYCRNDEWQVDTVWCCCYRWSVHLVYNCPVADQCSFCMMVGVKFDMADGETLIIQWGKPMLTYSSIGVNFELGNRKLAWAIGILSKGNPFSGECSRSVVLDTVIIGMFILWLITEVDMCVLPYYPGWDAEP